MFRVIVAGTRTFNDYALLKYKLDRILRHIDEPIVIVSGKVHGVDSLGERYAREKGYGIQEHPADWSIGKSAGYIRNTEMAKNADALVLFWNVSSRGSKHMLDLAKKENLMIRVIKYKEV